MRPCEPGASGVSSPRKTQVSETAACLRLSPLLPLGAAIGPGLAGPGEGCIVERLCALDSGALGLSPDSISNQLCDPAPSHSLSVPQFPPLSRSLL